jgi:hypothetical protein
MSNINPKKLEEILAERFAALPVTVQSAINDASVEEKLRTLAGKHKLHLDQWVLLENEIMLTLLGISDPEDMAENIAKEVNVSKEVAEALVNDIAREIFTPIRELLQENLEGATEEVDTRPTIKADPSFDLPAEDVPAPSTPAETEGEGETADTETTPEKQFKEASQPSSGAYQSGKLSTERKDVADDPYRESID